MAKGKFQRCMSRELKGKMRGLSKSGRKRKFAAAVKKCKR